MISLLRTWWGICLLQVTPQQLPASRELLWLTLLCYFLMDLGISWIGAGFLRALPVALFDTLLMIGLIGVFLQLHGRLSRFNQTVQALAGTGFIVGLIAWPVVFALERALRSGSALTDLILLWYLLFGWSILVTGHIVRHALEVSLLRGLFYALFLAVISYLVLQTLFPPDALIE